MAAEEAQARRRPDFGDTKHAPHLLEGPSIYDEGLYISSSHVL